MMKITPLFSISAAFLLFSNLIFAQVGIGTSSPQGILDIDSSIYGVVYPSVELTTTTDAAPVVNPQGGTIEVGTTIYNTNETFTGANDVEPGIYSWDGTQWVTHFFKRQSELFEQTTSLRSASSAGWEDIPGLGVAAANTFTAEYSGLYKIEVKVNYGGGDMKTSGTISDVHVGLAEGDFRFIFNAVTHNINVKSYSTYNANISSGTFYSNVWIESYKTIYINLTAGTTYPLTLEFDQATANGFEGNGNSGTGLGYIGDGIPCFAEFTYLDE